MLSRARIATLACFLFIGAVALFAIVDRARAGEPAVGLAATGSDQSQYIVTGAQAGGALQRGDRIAIDDPRELAAYELHALAVGARLHVRRVAPSPAVNLTIPVVPKARPSYSAAVYVIEPLFLGIAALIAARGRSNGSLSLAWLFALIVLLFNPTTSAWPGWLLMGYEVAGGGIAILAFFCATDFATRFTGDPNAVWARRYRAVSLGVALAAVALGIVLSVTALGNSPLGQAAELFPLIAQALCFLGGLAIAYTRAPPAERQRVAWVTASLAIGSIGFVATVLLQASGVPEPQRDLPLLLLIAMPLGCAYAILRYRLLDIAFVVNRATVFGVTSLLLLAALALVDFGLQTLVGFWLTRTGIYVQLGLALAIGIATRPIHERVDRFVDDIFFRQRHEAERTLRRFVREVAYIDDTDVVLARTVETVERAAALRCTVLLASSGGGNLRVTTGASTDAPAEVDRNDGAVVRLLATREPADLHDVQTALLGDYAFPMFARNRLLGVLVCGGKADGVAAYAPDELEAIGAVAHATGLALDLLRIEALERELGRLRSEAAV